MRVFLSLLLLLFIAGVLSADIFILKSYQTVEGTVTSETKQFFIIKKKDNNSGLVRKENVLYRIPSMKVSELIKKGKEYIEKKDFAKAYYFFLAGEHSQPKSADVLVGLIRCLIEKKKYDKAISKSNYALLWTKSAKLQLLKAEAFSLNGDFDKADGIYLLLKKSYPNIRKIVDACILENQKRRKLAKYIEDSNDKKDFDSKFGNCKNAVANADKILKWSQETDEKTFLWAELNLYVSRKKVTSFKDDDNLRRSVAQLDFTIVVDKERFYGEKAVLDNKDRKILAMGWYFFLKKEYPNAQKLEIEIDSEYINKKNEKRTILLAKIYWVDKGDKIVIEYDN